MTKKQKIALAISLATLIIPEILWNQYLLLIFFWMTDAIFSYWPKEIPNIDFLGLSNYPVFSLFISIIKVIGLIIIIILLKLKFQPKNKLIKPIILTPLFFLLIMAIYITISFFKFNPQIG